MNVIIKEWRLKPHACIYIDRNIQLDVLLFADDLPLLASTESDLQRSIYNFHIMASKYNMEISTESKVIVYRGKEPVTNKIRLTKWWNGRTLPTSFICYDFKER